MCECVCVCVCVCLCTCVHVCVRVYECLHASCVHVCRYLPLSVRPCVYLCFVLVEIFYIEYIDMLLKVCMMSPEYSYHEALAHTISLC